VLNILKRMLSSSPDIEVVGTAGHGQEALELIPLLQPAVVCTDLYMPVMNGLELTREIMARYPRPILVVSVSVDDGSSHVFNVLEAGALDVFAKPRHGFDAASTDFAADLAQKIKILAGVRVFRKSAPPTPAPAAATPYRQRPALKIEAPVRLVVMGASTGGPQALRTILTGLPANFPCPVICIQHISEGFLPGLMEWLASECRLEVTIAQPGHRPVPGVVYFPREQTHLTFDHQGRFVTSLKPPVDGHRPSITLTMQSAAQCFDRGVVGILLTGMGKDGADGLQAIARAGGITIAQDKATCVVFGMPRQAIELGAAQFVMSLEEVADTLSNGLWTNRMVDHDNSGSKAPGTVRQP